MGRKIVITSGKGGVGKTTITANLGIALAMQKKKVVLVDGDIGLNNLDVVMNIENRIIYDLGDVAEGRCRIKQALVQDNFFSNLYILPSSKTIENEKISTKIFTNIISELSLSFDYVLIDCPAGIEQSFHRSVNGANEAIVVTTPHISAVRDADKVLTLLSTYDIKNVGLIVNRLKGNLVSNGKMMDALDISKLLHVSLKGALPDDDYINLYSQIEKIQNNKNDTQQAYIFLAKNIEGKDTKIFNCTAKYKNILGKIKLIMRG